MENLDEVCRTMLRMMFRNELFEKTPNINAFLLADHGVVAMGKDPLAAEHTAELVEETAQVAILDKVVEKLGL